MVWTFTWSVVAITLEPVFWSQFSLPDLFIRYLEVALCPYITLLPFFVKGCGVGQQPHITLFIVEILPTQINTSQNHSYQSQTTESHTYHVSPQSPLSAMCVFTNVLSLTHLYKFSRHLTEAHTGGWSRVSSSTLHWYTADLLQITTVSNSNDAETRPSSSDHSQHAGRLNRSHPVQYPSHWPLQLQKRPSQGKWYFLYSCSLCFLLAGQVVVMADVWLVCIVMMM